MSVPLVETVGLVHVFENQKRGLDGIDLVFQPGSFHVMAGANGSGKTLFLRHLVGLLKPTEGQILLNGQLASQNWTRARSLMGFLFQDSDAQILEPTVIEDTLFALRQKGIEPGTALAMAHKVLLDCGLDGRDDDLTSNLSGGEKRRLNLAGVLTLGAEVLLLDEPFTGLDQPGVEGFLKILVELHSQGKTIILVTHDLDKCLAHADTLVLWKNGQVLASGSPWDLWERIPDAGVHRPKIERQKMKELTWLAQ